MSPDTFDPNAFAAELAAELGLLGTRSAEHAARASAYAKENSALRERLADLEKKLIAPVADISQKKKTRRRN